MRQYNVKTAVCLIIALLISAAFATCALGEETTADGGNNNSADPPQRIAGDDAGENDIIISDSGDETRNLANAGESANQNDVNSASNGDNKADEPANEDDVRNDDAGEQNSDDPQGGAATHPPEGEPEIDSGEEPGDDEVESPNADSEVINYEEILEETVPGESDGESTLAQSLVVSIDKTTLSPGQTAKARCEVFPETADADIQWSSSNDNIARVSNDGTISIPSDADIDEAGEYVDIWAKATDGSLVMNLKTIYVLPSVSSVKLFIGSTTVYAGDDAPFLSVYVDIQPQSLFGKTPIEWRSSNTEIALVQPEGRMGEAATIIWRDPGEVTIEAYSAINPDCSDDMRLTVLPAQN
ncbi:MAG: Ig-like domain-containing protein [Clostridia bacterium]|nr:Ig-like domain-containing protein [Clostridia bacterium]